MLEHQSPFDLSVFSQPAHAGIPVAVQQLDDEEEDKESKTRIERNLKATLVGPEYRIYLCAGHVLRQRSFDGVAKFSCAHNQRLCSGVGHFFCVYRSAHCLFSFTDYLAFSITNRKRKATHQCATAVVGTR